MSFVPGAADPSSTGVARRLVPLLLALVAVASNAAAAHAQAADSTEWKSEGRGFFQAGSLFLDTDALNAELAGAGLPGLDGTSFTIGGGGYGTVESFLIGLEGHAILGSTETSGDGAFQTSLGGGYGLFRLGYLAVDGDALDVYPTLGVGGGQVNVKIRERSAPTFDDVLGDPQRSSSLSSRMLLLDLGVGVDYRIRVDSDDDEFGGLLVGLTGGYTFAPGSPSWRLDGINGVAGGPELLIQGFYLRASIGGWGGERGGGEGNDEM